MRSAALATAQEIWLQVAPVPADAVPPLNPGVDAGESSSIALAVTLKDALLIIDDKAGRHEARVRSLRTLGLLGVLALANDHGHIPALTPLMERLRSGGYFIAPALAAQILRSAGE